MKGHYRLIPGRVGPSSKPLEQDQKQTSDPQNRCLSHPINQQQRSSFITDPLSFSVFLLRSRPSSELWARHCFFFLFFLHLWLLCACSRLPWWWENGARFVFTRHAQQEQRARRVGRWDRDAQCGVRSSASLCACQKCRMASCPFDDPPSWWMVKKCVPDQKIVTRWEGDGEEAYEVPLFSSSTSSSQWVLKFWYYFLMRVSSVYISQCLRSRSAVAGRSAVISGDAPYLTTYVPQVVNNGWYLFINSASSCNNMQLFLHHFTPVVYRKDVEFS